METAIIQGRMKGIKGRGRFSIRWTDITCKIIGHSFLKWIHCRANQKSHWSSLVFQLTGYNGHDILPGMKR